MTGAVGAPGKVVALYHAQRQLGMSSALLVCVPVPEEYEIPAPQLQEILDNALAEATRHNIAGRELTPFLLKKMATASGGVTVRTNIALLENNARVAAEIACAL